MKSSALIYAGSFLVAALATALSARFWKRVCVRFHLVDNPGERKIHAEAMPLAGGLSVFTGIILALIIVVWVLPLMGVETRKQFKSGIAAAEFLALLLGAQGMLILGIIDDRWELRASAKFWGQFLIALGVAISGLRITLFVPSVAFSYLITIFWILTIVNAFNFMDNMNGLCAGLSAIATFLFGVSAAYRDEHLVAALAFLCCGAFCGFLPHNFPRATAFLGDSGSHLAGFLVAVLAILPDYYSSHYPHKLSVLTPLLVLAVPLLDLATVVIIRWRLGKSFYIGDNNHLSHQLVRRGLSESQAVLILWTAGFLLGALSLLL